LHRALSLFPVAMPACAVPTPDPYYLRTAKRKLLSGVPHFGVFVESCFFSRVVVCVLLLRFACSKSQCLRVPC
jgi:hypothetical protein